MSPEQRDRAINVVQMIQADVESDTRRRDGQPLTGATVGAALGEMCAQIGALAKVVETLLREHQGAQA